MTNTLTPFQIRERERVENKRAKRRREMFHFLYKQGWAACDIAEQCDEHVSTVKKILKQALQNDANYEKAKPIWQRKRDEARKNRNFGK